MVLSFSFGSTHGTEESNGNSKPKIDSIRRKLCYFTSTTSENLKKSEVPNTDKSGKLHLERERPNVHSVHNSLGVEKLMLCADDLLASYMENFYRGTTFPGNV